MTVHGRQPAGRRRSRMRHGYVGDIAAERIAQLAYDIGDEVALKYGWITYAARRMGLQPQTLASIVSGDYGPCGLRIIQQVSRKTGCTIGTLLGEDDE